MTTMPYSPSSGYWSTNEEEASDSSTFDLDLFPSAWVLDLHTQLKPEVMSEEEETKVDQFLFTLESDLESKLKSTSEIKQEMDEVNEENPGADDPQFGSEVDPCPAPTGSSLLADFLFSDFHEGHQDRILDDFSDDIVFPIDEDHLLNGFIYEFHDSETDPNVTWKDSGDSEVQIEDSLATGDGDRKNCDTHQLFTNENSLEEFLRPFQSTSGVPNRRRSSPISRSSDRNEPEVDQCSPSACASPVTDGESVSCPSPSSVFPSLDADDYLDCLLFDAFDRSSSPLNDVIPEVETLKVILVTASGATKRKSNEINRHPRKMLHMNHTWNTKGVDIDVASCDNSAVSALTSPAECPQEKQENRASQLETLGKSEEEEPKEEEEALLHLRNASSVSSTNASAGRTAEVLATMLTTDGVLREPNRGSDVIFEELKTRKDPPRPTNSTGQRGATSLRSFLIQRQRQTQGSGQNLLQRLLEGQTTEAEIRREMASKEQAQ